MSKPHPDPVLCGESRPFVTNQSRLRVGLVAVSSVSKAWMTGRDAVSDQRQGSGYSQD